jgi:hypothetical protein
MIQAKKSDLVNFKSLKFPNENSFFDFFYFCVGFHQFAAISPFNFLAKAAALFSLKDPSPPFLL